MKRYVKAAKTTGDFTIIQNIYSDGMEYMENDSVEPVYVQEYEVDFDDVLANNPDILDGAMRDWTDETFEAGEIISLTAGAAYIKRMIGEPKLYSDYLSYVRSHDLPDPARDVEVRINNPTCLPSAEAYRKDQSEKLGKYVGEKLGLRRY